MNVGKRRPPAIYYACPDGDSLCASWVFCIMGTTTVCGLIGLIVFGHTCYFHNFMLDYRFLWCKNTPSTLVGTH